MGWLMIRPGELEGVGADFMVQPPGASFLLAFSQAPMPIKIGDRLKEIPHVRPWLRR